MELPSLKDEDVISRKRIDPKPTMNGTSHHSNSQTSSASSESCSTRLLQQWSWQCKMLVLLLEKLFEKFAWFVSKRPFHVIFSALLLAIVLTIGFAYLDAENNVKYLFMPENSEASRDIVRARELGFEMDMRREEIVVLTKPNKTLLSKECLAEMMDLHETIIKINQYERYCYRADPTSSCASVNLLELFGYSRDRLIDIKGQIRMALQSDAFVMANGRPLRDNFYSIFGKETTYNSLDLTKALRSVYYMTEHYSGNQRADILNWESTFIERMAVISKNITCVDVLYSAERSLDDSVTESTGSDIKFFAVTFTIMGVFSSFVNGRCADSRYGHQLLAFAALLAIYLGVTSSFGLLMFCKVPFISMVGVLPFLVVSIGIDDVFIILHELNELVRTNLPAVYMLSGTMARSGPTITMTTLTDLVAFAVSCRSLFPSVRFFCAYAALSITFAFLMLVTFFVGCIWFDIKRIKGNRRDFVPCFLNPPPRDCCNNARRNALDNVMKAWGRVITTTAGKVVVCLLSAVMLSSGLYGALHVDESFSRQLLTTRDSHYRRFLNAYEKNFKLDIEVSLIVPGRLDYPNLDIQRKYLDLQNIAKSNHYFKQHTVSWLSEFLFWANGQKIDINSTKNFYKNLQFFLSLPRYKRFTADIKFSKNKTRIVASRILVYTKSSPDSNFQKGMMLSIRKDISRLADINVFSIAFPFVYFEQYAQVLNETIRNLVVAGISILVISSCFLNHPMIILCLLCGFVALILELLGLMFLWNVSLNSISMIILVMALGFSVDYNAHVAYQFASSKANCPEDRIIDALGRVGGSVFLGGLSTLLGMMTTGLASSLVFQTFFKMFIGIVVLGLLHGLVILPVYLTILGKVFDLHVEAASFNLLLQKWYNWRKSRAPLSTKKNKILDRSVKSKVSPVAVVGIGCRFPAGANTKDEFWNMLIKGKCGIATYPKDRPSTKDFEDSYNPGRNTPGKHYTLTGAYLDNITGFDAQFFGISSTESRSMDPQQRLLLHVVYEAIEDGGLRLEDLQKCRTGVYVGLMNLDFGTLLLDASNLRKVDQFAATGCTSSVAANRISFSLNFTGPSLTVDTACSSSLTALDLAFKHLQTNECDVAIVCAPNILLSGGKFHTACCRSGLLAQDGRCKSFDIKGDGYGRGEGVAAVVLKHAETAIQDRDDIYAEIIASGLNNDGQSSIPMTSPSEATQAMLAQRVLLDSGLSKDDIQYVEAHGTGTAIGDVVEMGSVSAVYGNSSNRLLRVGSVKSNINHTESTAGLAGLIKTCLMIKYKHFVPTINVHEVKPQLKMSERKMMVQVEEEPWNPDSGKPRTAAVCSYGYGGANAHLILREVTQHPTITPSRSRLNRVMTLSASSNDALKALAKKFSQTLETKPDDDQLLKDNICYSLNERYTVHRHRLALTFSSFKQAARALNMFSDQEKGWREMVTTSDAVTSRSKLVFLYGGQGTQWYGMAREMVLYEQKFKESLEKIDKILKQQNVSWSLMTELNKSEETSRLQENPIGQTALFAVHYALTELLKSWGITPAAVVGHSLGEISAACASGALRLAEALQLVLIRSRLHERCSPTGCMAAIGMSERDAKNMLHKLQVDDRVDVAVVNSPRDVVLSGDNESMKNVECHVCGELQSVFWKKLRTNRAFHSREMEEIRESFEELTRKRKFRPSSGNVPFYSTVTGTQISGKVLSCDHWWKNIRQAVLLSSAIENIFADGFRTFIEINAGPQLSRHVNQIWSHHNKARTESENVVVIETLPKRSVSQQHKCFLQNCVAHLFAHGVPLSWNRIQSSGTKSFIRRPTYPWQESEFWFREAYPIEHVSFLENDKTEEHEIESEPIVFHPLLGKSVCTLAFSGLHAWESEIDLYRVSYLKDHTFAESPDPIVPGAVYIEMALAMVLHMFPRMSPNVHNITFRNLLTLSISDSLRIRTRLHTNQSPPEGSLYQITRVKEDDGEVILSEGSVRLDIAEEYCNLDITATESLADYKILKTRMLQRSQDYLREKQRNMGFDFGPQFNLIKEGWSSDDEALATICLTDEIRQMRSSYVVHPSIIDACFQTLLLVKHPEGKFVPYRIDSVTILRREMTDRLFSHVTTVQREEKHYNITLMDCFGRVLMSIKGFVGINLAAVSTATSFKNTAFKMQWGEEELSSEADKKTTEHKSWAILQDESGYAQLFAEHLPTNESKTFLKIESTPEEICSKFSEMLEVLVNKLKIQEKKEKLVIVDFWPIDTRQQVPKTQSFVPSHRLAFESSLLIVQQLLKREDVAKEMQLVFVTSAVVSIPNKTTQDSHVSKEHEPLFPWSSSLFGFRRTMSEEVNAPKVSVVDLPENPTPTDFTYMMKDLRRGEISEEIAYRNGLRYINRLTRLVSQEPKSTKEKSPLTESGEPKPFQLSFMSDKLYLREINCMQLEKGSVIEVAHACPVFKSRWTNLSTRDYVTVAGKMRHNLPHEHSDDLVVGICEAGDLGNYVRPETCYFTKINDMTTEQAASLCFPIAMSYYLLNEVLKDVKEKHILVYHEQDQTSCVFACVALSMGMSVVSLTKNKRSKDRLQDFGIPFVYTQDEVMTDDEVNLPDLHALYFLSKPRPNLVPLVMNHLKPSGTVVMISSDKTAKVNSFDRPQDFNLIFTSLDDVTKNPEKFSCLLASSTSLLLSSGFLQRLLNTIRVSSSIYEVVRSGDISQNMDQLNCNLVSLKPSNSHKMVNFYRLALDSRGFRQNRTYLVIGGVRGFGFEVARWMVANGAGTVMCTARSSPNEEKIAEVKRLECETGSRILLRQADVTSWKDMAVIKDELEHLPDVAGIVFSAMVLQDQLIKEADLPTCERVISTKVQGSVLLHQLSLSMDLDFFIMFSSITSVLGNVGQVSYGAANAFLDFLCEYRRYKLGLPALSINWGPISGAGVLERFKDVAALLEKQGFHPLNSKTGMEFLQRILLENPDEAQVCLCDMNWPAYLTTHLSPRLQLIRDEVASSTHLYNMTTLKDLALLPLEERVSYVQEFVKNLLASWSGADVSEVDLNTGLYKYGIDSIGAANMTIQIRNTLGASFETYYFIQPKTSGLTIINDILEQIENESQPDQNQATDGETTSVSSCTNDQTLTKDGDQHDLQCEATKLDEKVFPLYTPDEAAVKVFMVHSSHKSALANAAFALGFQQQTLVAFYSIGLGDTKHHTSNYGTVQILAKRYVKLIQNEQPRGPYYLAGFSFGGTLVYEIASVLTEQDEEIAMVFMVDTNTWFPKALAYGRQLFLSKSELFHRDMRSLVTKLMIQRLAYIALGVAPKELDQLRKNCKDDDDLIKILDEKAVASKVPLDLQQEVNALQFQLRGAMIAHNEWQPAKVRYKGTLIYIRCEETKIVPLFWDGPQMWKSLTGRMDLLLVPGEHMDQKDEIHGKLDGALMMTAAAMKYRTKYSMLNPSGLRIRAKERQIDWLKKGVNISMYTRKGSTTLLKGTFWLGHDETLLTFASERLGLVKKQNIALKDLNNILPGRYVNAVQKSSIHKTRIDLIVCMITDKGKHYNLLCNDIQQLNQLMDGLDALFDIPFVRVNH